MSNSNNNIFKENLTPDQITFIQSIVPTMDINGDPGQYNRAFVDTLWHVFLKFRKNMDTTSAIKARVDLEKKFKTMASYLK